MRRDIHLLVPLLSLVALAAAPRQSTDPVPRANYGAFLEPEDVVLHGAGKTDMPETELDEAFERYSKIVKEERLPILFMSYTAVDTTEGPYVRLRKRLEMLRKKEKQPVIPQIGLKLPPGGIVPAEGQLKRLVAGLKALRGPVFLRIGVQVNGSWHEPPYEPKSYQETFKVIAEAIRKKRLPVALVWSMYPGYSATDAKAKWKYIKQFYPGDEYVDWWSFDVFSAGEMTEPQRRQQIHLFLDAAEEHGKPVMIGEATPRYIGVEDAADWDQWFKPFFRLIHERKGIKAFSYVNWDWGLTQFHDWGNARFDPRRGHRPEASLLKKYREELDLELYLHAGDKFPKELKASSRKK